MKKRSEGQRITVTLSEMATRKLICWAKAHDKTKTAYAAAIIESRIEANIDLVDRLMSDIADSEGISVKELEERWLIEEGFWEAE
ncbi:MAG: hypothetical protein J7647_27865 [Cyanobacteria bacterium SBLK]|nr:hypothetical protein [Cyanobacteria bacterium SBLK]